MRTILFKAKRLDNGAWIEGIPIQSNIDGDDYKVYMYVDFTVKNVMELNSGHGHFGKCVEVNPESVCEFIGLLDKNGNNIFEGDIMEAWGGTEYNGMYEYNYTGCVIFNHGEFYINHKNRICINFGNIENYVTIGNKFDNAERLVF